MSEHQTESYVERKLAERVKARKGLAVKLGHTYRVGMPDRLVLLPPGRVLFVEVKATGAKRRPSQIAFAKVLARIGFEVKVLDHTTQIGKLLNNAT